MSQPHEKLREFLYALKDRIFDNDELPELQDVQVQEMQTGITGMREFIVVLNRTEAYSIWENPTGEWGWEPYNQFQHMGI